jgi:cobalt/nickel transport protein
MVFSILQAEACLLVNISFVTQGHEGFRPEGQRSRGLFFIQGGYSDALSFYKSCYIGHCLISFDRGNRHGPLRHGIPSDTMVMQEDDRILNVALSFSHPMEMVGMDLAKPKHFDVSANGKKQDLLGELKPVKVMDHSAWETAYPIKRPGVYVFHMEPEPYWEPVEDCFIIHLTKTVVTAFGDDEGWDAELGLRTEIVPIAKPFGLYAGNVFQGIVKMDGKPVPFAEVEVEYYNREKKAKAPIDTMVTQTIKADGNGIFTYATPSSGWWGFAALNSAGYTIEQDGHEKDVEMGAVIWVYFHEWNQDGQK